MRGDGKSSLAETRGGIRIVLVPSSHSTMSVRLDPRLAWIGIGLPCLTLNRGVGDDRNRLGRRSAWIDIRLAMDRQGLVRDCRWIGMRLTLNCGMVDGLTDM